MPVETGRPRNRSFISNNEGAFTLNGAPFYNDAGVNISGVFESVAYAGEYTVTAGDATANAATIATGHTTVAVAVAQVVDSGDRVVTSDADITWSAGNLVVADGGTYNTTAGYKVRWIAFGV
jgi:hypothetical protein